MKTISLLVLSFAYLSLAFTQSKPIMYLRDVNTVYVESLGSTDDAKEIREALISSILLTGRLKVTDKADKADVIVKGTATLVSSQLLQDLNSEPLPDTTQSPRPGPPRRQTVTLPGNKGTQSGPCKVRYDAFLHIKLITADNRTLYEGESKSKRVRVCTDVQIKGGGKEYVKREGTDAISDVAVAAKKQLLKAIEKDEKKGK
jgi:hypothetical protein